MRDYSTLKDPEGFEKRRAAAMARLLAGPPVFNDIERVLHTLVDVVHGYCYEDRSVPSHDTADRLIVETYARLRNPCEMVNLGTTPQVHTALHEGVDYDADMRGWFIVYKDPFLGEVYDAEGPYRGEWEAAEMAQLHTVETFPDATSCTGCA